MRCTDSVWKAKTGQVKYFLNFLMSIPFRDQVTVTHHISLTILLQQDKTIDIIPVK